MTSIRATLSGVVLVALAIQPAGACGEPGPRQRFDHARELAMGGYYGRAHEGLESLTAPRQARPSANAKRGVHNRRRARRW